LAQVLLLIIRVDRLQRGCCPLHETQRVVAEDKARREVACSTAYLGDKKQTHRRTYQFWWVCRDRGNANAGMYEFSLPIKADKVPTGAEWIHEIKCDGYRMPVVRDQDRVRLVSRGVMTGPIASR
jgi:hypothetical protein